MFTRDRAHTHKHPEQGHSHGLVNPSIKRSREGLRVLATALTLLAATAVAQGSVYVLTGSVALLADLIHNAGDALTAIPLAVAFLLRSERAERYAGLSIVLTILTSAILAGAIAVQRIIDPLAPQHLSALVLAGAIGVLGNTAAARVRLSGGRRLASPALIADGNHARGDAILSASVLLTASAVAMGAPIADPVIGLIATILILRITHQSWHAIHAHRHSEASEPG